MERKSETSPSLDYHDYVIKDGRLVGKFEEMYRVCPDPWPETEDDLNNNPCSIRTRQIVAAHGFRKVLSVGSGKGFHLNWLSQTCLNTLFKGCEVSKTAVEHSRKAYPHLQVSCLDIKDFSDCSWDFDLILFREVIWYVLDYWTEIVEGLKERHAGKHVVTELTFYDNQTYGREFFDGPDEFADKFPFEILEVVRYHTTRRQRNGMMMVFGRI